MSRQANEQIPFGELLTKARLEKRMSRAQLAKETGIAENSLIRYEKAGLEDDGQYPPSPKLAVICYVLGMSPLRAMLSCIDADLYCDFNHSLATEYADIPQYDYVMNENIELGNENRKLRSLVKILSGANTNVHKEAVDWLKTEVKSIFDQEERFSDLCIRSHLYDHNDGIVSIPGPNWREIEKARRSRMENGPDHHEGNPGRLSKSTKHEAVDAASTSKPRKKRSD